MSSDIESQELIPREARPAKDHLVVVQSVYHQPYGEEATSAETRYSRELETQEQVYVRRVTVGEKWQPLDCGWIERVGMILIENPAPQFQTNPTQEERDAATSKVIAIGWGCTSGIGGAEWFIPIGDSFRAFPTESSRVYLRCRNGETKVTLRIYPA